MDDIIKSINQEKRRADEITNEIIERYRMFNPKIVLKLLIIL